MDLLLGKVTQQAMNYAIRSGVTLTASYAIRQSSKLLQTAPQSNVRDELFALQQRLQHKIRIVSPAIDMIELIAARGNTSLESAVSLAKELRLEIQDLGQRLGKAAAASEDYATGSSRNKATIRAQNELELKFIVVEIKALLERIEDAVPLINLALTTSGAKLSTQLPSTVSPSRLLQASTFLTAGDTQYAMSPQKVAQIGPTFTLTVYMLFAGHDRPENEEEIRNTTWKEVIHKARVKLRRVPLDVVIKTGSGSDALPSTDISAPIKPEQEDLDPENLRADVRTDEYAYQIMIVEDFDDDRIHEFDQDEAQPGRFDDVRRAGIREMIPIHEISKIFYADTSKVLNIGTDMEGNHPVLLLKRDVNAVPPRRMYERGEPEAASSEDGFEAPDEKSHGEQEYVKRDHDGRNEDPWRLPPSLDPEWIAFEVYTEAEADEDDDDSDTADTEDRSTLSPETSGISSPRFSGLHPSNSQLSLNPNSNQKPASRPQPWLPQIRTSLSMLELLLRLTSLQQFQQQSHLSIPDELLNFFLEESATTGAGGNEAHRQAIRADARRRVGWDPYDESPMKRRGEDYLYRQDRPSATPYDDSSYQMSSPRRSPQPDFSNSMARSGVGSSGSYRAPHRGVSYLSPSRYTGDAYGGYPSSPAGGVQTRSITGTPTTQDGNGNGNDNGGGGGGDDDDDGRDKGFGQGANIASPSPAKQQNRTEWLRRQEGPDKRGSPLSIRPKTAVTDEGIGTSPGSAQ